MAALFTAFDTSTLATSVTAVLTVGVSIALLYLGATHIGRGRKKLEKA